LEMSSSRRLVKFTFVIIRIYLMVVGPLVYFLYKHNSFVVIGDHFMVAFVLINFLFKHHRLLGTGATN
jgi:hypothetical protein